MFQVRSGRSLSVTGKTYPPSHHSDHRHPIGHLGTGHSDAPIGDVCGAANQSLLNNHSGCLVRLSFYLQRGLIQEDISSHFVCHRPNIMGENLGGNRFFCSLGLGKGCCVLWQPLDGNALLRATSLARVHRKDVLHGVTGHTGDIPGSHQAFGCCWALCHTQLQRLPAPVFLKSGFGNNYIIRARKNLPKAWNVRDYYSSIECLGVLWTKPEDGKNEYEKRKIQFSILLFQCLR